MKIGIIDNMKNEAKKIKQPKKKLGAEATIELKLKQKNEKIELKAKKARGKKRRVDEFVRRGSTKKAAPILIVNDIKKNFGNFQALKGISFEVARGERIGLIGGNGAGKTTVSEIIAGINKPTSGTLTYGFDFVESPKEGIGMQFQQSEYPSGLTVKDILQFAIHLRKLDVDKEELQDLLRVFQMSDFYTRKVRSLSGGQRQKLNILLSIIHNPQLVILDELSTGLDISAREEIIDFTDRLLTKRNMSAILISHHMQEIRALCSRVIILDNGEVRDIKTIKEVERKYKSLENYSKKLIAESNLKLIKMEQDKKAGIKDETQMTKRELRAKAKDDKIAARQALKKETNAAKLAEKTIKEKTNGKKTSVKKPKKSKAKVEKVSRKAQVVIPDLETKEFKTPKAKKVEVKKPTAKKAKKSKKTPAKAKGKQLSRKEIKELRKEMKKKGGK